MKKDLALNLVYTLEGTIYINLTNKCSNACVFCIRNSSNSVEGKSLWLENEDFSAEEVIEQFETVKKECEEATSVVFCGFGEPLIKFDIFKEVASYIKRKHPLMKIRVNTNGQANLISGRNLIPLMRDFTDAVSISLNAETKEKYNKISRPQDKENAYDAVKYFIRNCVREGFDTTATVVSGFPNCDIDVEKCREIAEKELFAKFRVREWLPNGY